MNWLFNKLMILLAPDEGGGGGSSGETPEEGSSEGDKKGGDMPKFESQLSPEVREKYKDDLKAHKDKHLNDVVSEYFEGKKRAARSILIPDAKKPDPEEKKAFFKALGIPEKAEDYGINVEKFKKEKNIEVFAREFSKTALTLGLSKNQAQAMFEYMAGFGQAANENRKKQQKEFEDGFEARVLEAVGKDEAKKAETLNYYKKFMASEVNDRDVIKLLVDRGVFHNEKVALSFANVMKKYSDEKFVGGRPRGGKDAEGKKGTLGNYSPEFLETYGGK